jgi:hypothetical protein
VNSFSRAWGVSDAAVFAARQGAWSKGYVGRRVGCMRSGVV